MCHAVPLQWSHGLWSIMITVYRYQVLCTWCMLCLFAHLVYRAKPTHFHITYDCLMNYGKVEVKYEYYYNEMSSLYMVFPWQHVYGCNIIFETCKSNIEMIVWVVFSQLLTQIHVPCIITRNLFLRSWSFFQKKNLEGVFHCLSK